MLSPRHLASGTVPNDRMPVIGLLRNALDMARSSSFDRNFDILWIDAKVASKRHSASAMVNGASAQVISTRRRKFQGYIIHSISGESIVPEILDSSPSATPPQPSMPRSALQGETWKSGRHTLLEIFRPAFSTARYLRSSRSLVGAVAKLIAYQQC